MDDKAKQILARHEQLRSERCPYESNWQDIVELVRPGTSDFHKGFSPSQTRTEKIYDGTAPQALGELASGLHSHLTSAAERWFACEVEEMNELENEPEALMWLDDVADIIYEHYSNPITNLNSALNECYMDIGAFGMCVLNQEWSSNTGHLNFRAFPLADCWIDENADGKVDTLHRETEMTKRQMIQMFGEENLPQKIREDTNSPVTKKWCVVHAVYPRIERKLGNYTAKNKRFASCWVAKEYCHTLKESGYNSFPYHVPRWSTLAGEVYGRGPGIGALPDIRMLNRMEYTIIRAAQKAVDPPIQVPNDGFMPNIKANPGAIWLHEPGAERAEALDFKANIPIGLELSEQRRDAIRAAFFAPFLKLKDKKAEQTAYEIQEIVDEQLRFMEPMFGRLQSEMLGPQIARSYELLNENGRIPVEPEVLSGRRLKVVYISPAARAQKSRKALGVRKFFEGIVPFAQVKPEVMDAINFDGATQELALAMGVSRKAINAPETIVEIRRQRAKQAEMQMLAEAAEPVSKAVLNISQAQKAAAA